MTTPGAKQNPDRARRYVTQALALFHKIQGAIPPDQVGTWVSLQRNLESALVDLGGTVTQPFPPPTA